MSENDPKALEQELAALREEVDRLRKENDSLKRRLGEQPEEPHYYKPGPVSDAFDEYVEREGVLWKRAASGGVERLVYCAACRLVMLPTPSDNPVSFVCTKCGGKAPFEAGELDTVIERVNASV